MVLILLAMLLVALLTLWPLGAFIARPALTYGGIAACGAVAGLAAVAAGSGTASLDLVIGPPGGSMRLALDPLAASFLLLVFVTRPCAGLVPVQLAGAGLALLAGDAFTLIVGLFVLAGRASLPTTLGAAVCLIAAFALAGASADFAAMHAIPPEGWRAAAVLFLVLIGAGILTLIDTVIAGYLLIRVLFDLCGPSQPLWWGIPLLLAGAGIAVTGTLRAALAEALHTALSALTLLQFGVAVMGFGAALLARAVDLPSVAARALAATWLALVCHALCRTLFRRCADAVEAGAGTRRLDRLGGLLHRMPVTACCCLAGLLAVAVLPTGLGFAAFWLLFQSLLAGARIGGFGLQVLIVCVTLLVTFSAALALLAAVRLFGVVFIGRPRTPRGAVAEEAPRQVRLVLGGVTGLTLLLGLVPGLGLLPSVGWTEVHVPWVVLSTGEETPGYPPIVIAVFLAVTVLGPFRILRRLREPRREPLWSDGFAAAPPWQPFGDPATQYGSASFVGPVHRMLGALPPVRIVLRPLVRLRAMARRSLTALVTR